MKQKNIKTNDVELVKKYITQMRNNVLQLEYTFHSYLYEEESVNRSQMDIKRKTFDIRTWKKHLLLDIASINIDALVPSRYQCVEIRSIGVF
jgi:hypothetical protein